MSGLLLKVTPEQVNQAKRLMTSAILESIRLIHVRAAHMVPGCPVKDIKENPMPTVTANLIQDSNRFRVVFDHAIHGNRGPQGETAVQVDASFELLYSFPKEMDPSPALEELNAFANTNAVMNCWPYWRELVQSNVAKMNLPPLVVPLLRWAPQPPKQEPKPTEGAAVSAIKKVEPSKVSPVKKEVTKKENA